MLVSGDYFGEVSFLYKCRRTTTIKAKLYATLGRIDHTLFENILRDYPDFKSQIKTDIVKLYDDDVKLFLIHAFRKVDYMKDVPEEILVNLAYLCNAEIKEKGSLLFNMDEDPDEQITDELIIIFEGGIELFIYMDAGTEFSLENLPTGSIINAHNMLAGRKHSVNARMSTNTTFYYLKYSKLVEVAKIYPKFARTLLREKGNAEALKSRDQNPVDYILGNQLYTDPNNR